MEQIVDTSIYILFTSTKAHTYGGILSHTVFSVFYTHSANLIVNKFGEPLSWDPTMHQGCLLITTRTQ